MFQKKERIRNKKHLDFLRNLPCVVCVSYQAASDQSHCDPAHIRIKSNSGIGIKPSDDRCVPLCAWHHRRQHQVGEVTFWSNKIDEAISLAKALYDNTGDRDICVELIRNSGL